MRALISMSEPLKRRCQTAGAAADDQHVGFQNHIDAARRFGNLLEHSMSLMH